MLLLTIDSSAGASVALTRDGAPLDAWRTEQTTSHAEVLAPAVQRMMIGAGVTGADLDGVAVGVGPGPFTGLRVGLALAHALAEAWRKPLHGICSLDSLALRATDAGVEGEFLVATDARRREVYWAQYIRDEKGSRLVRGPFGASATDLPELPAVGAGLGLYPQELRPATMDEDPSAWVPDAAELGQLAEGALVGELHGVLCQARPLYLRESDAQVPVQMRQGGS
ncbi:tRNA (adenosine(37)-N6)-threonylcarbamoyltransferase complex dimerization subunit type 1 TsaB [Nesterenkonia natronophila]|uniref:tRNA (Adenosine(37)-N6)-threonylcarbamoyltransferase complex dimerization subunit type 1 TsaB n=1 Tax=Nesterenkonia natronophila TaxID=2174932 RepID=A0A3A4FAA9_9MICC|nr:tRNA (adenosine(37)-N6)-threonylcarbamoyltransferase complex dimerization subunit type 1 TsaB [Nesterenkonia natronophila]RJN31734.1 tRNA (adenosine(37)-N6)-threonylcarbamoyltransferase complex dimerization subunit type 1 TsaB [Nesterenkonia natronophila]